MQDSVSCFAFLVWLLARTKLDIAGPAFDISMVKRKKPVRLFGNPNRTCARHPNLKAPAISRRTSLKTSGLQAAFVASQPRDRVLTSIMPQVVSFNVNIVEISSLILQHPTCWPWIQNTCLGCINFGDSCVCSWETSYPWCQQVAVLLHMVFSSLEMLYPKDEVRTAPWCYDNQKPATKNNSRH